MSRRFSAVYRSTVALYPEAFSEVVVPLCCFLSRNYTLVFRGQISYWGLECFILSVYSERGGRALGVGGTNVLLHAMHRLRSAEIVVSSRRLLALLTPSLYVPPQSRVRRRLAEATPSAFLQLDFSPSFATQQFYV
ncbi:unnamed protein product [Laminaria digitata]